MTEKILKDIAEEIKLQEEQLKLNKSELDNAEYSVREFKRFADKNENALTVLRKTLEDLKGF